MRVLICGGRDYNNFGEASNIIRNHLATMSSDPPKKEDVVFITGMARGADHIPFHLGDLDEWGGVLEFPADWDTYGKSAGHIRNQQMLDEGKPDLVIAFPTNKSRGTYDMINRAKKA